MILSVTRQRFGLGIGITAYLAVGGWVFYRMLTMTDDGDLSGLDPYRNAAVALVYVVLAALLVRNVRQGRVVRTLLMPIGFIVGSVVAAIAVLAIDLALS